MKYTIELNTIITSVLIVIIGFLAYLYLSSDGNSNDSIFLVIIGYIFLICLLVLSFLIQFRRSGEFLQKNDELSATLEELEASQDELRKNFENLLESEQNLRESEEKFRSLVENAFEPIAIVDMQGMILFVNQAACNVLEVPQPKVLINRNIIEFVSPESQNAVINDFTKVNQGFDGFVAEYKGVTANGNSIYIESIGKIISYNGNTADLLSLRDITNQKLIQQRLEKQNEVINEAYSELSCVEEHLRSNYNDLIIKERELRESEERFRAIFSMVPQPILLTKVSDGCVIDCNQAAVTLFGIVYDQIIGKTTFELSLWKDESERILFLSELNSKKSVNHHELHWRDPDGDYRYLLYSSRLLEIKGEEVLLNVGFDLSDLKRAEELLRESEEVFRNPVEHSPVGIFLAQEGFFQYINPRLAQMFGYPADQLLTLPLNSLFYNEKENAGIHFQELSLSSNSPQSIHELKGSRYDGSLIDLEVYTATMKFRGKNAIYGTIIDVTYRKQIETARQQSEKMYRLITENMQDVVWILDPETWFFRYVSPSVKRLRGYTAEEVMAQPFSASLDPDVYNYLKGVIMNKGKRFTENPSITEYYSSQLVLPCKDGKQITTETVTNFILNNETGKMEVLGVSRDITERKKFEREIESKTLELYEINEELSARNEELLAIEDERRMAYEELARKQALLTEQQNSLHNAQAIAHLGNWDWRIKENHFFASEEFYRIFGFESAEIIPSFAEICSHISNDGLSPLQNLILSLQNSGSGNSIDITITRPDGTKRILQVSGKAGYINGHELGQISLIFLDVTRQKEMEKELLEAAKEKEILLREIHHRVKNNMQIISSLISMQSRSLSDSHIQNLFKEIQTRVRTLSLVHEMLYKSENLNTIDYRNYIKSLSKYLLESYNTSQKEILFIIPDHEVILSLEKAVPCSLIITELITNSLKYAFSGRTKGEISIDLRYLDGLSGYVLDYQDNGTGFRIDPDTRQRSGFGMKLIHGLTKQLSGTSWVDESKPGVHYVITFPRTDGI